MEMELNVSGFNLLITINLWIIFQLIRQTN